MNWYPVNSRRTPPVTGQYGKRPDGQWQMWTGNAWLLLPADVQAEFVAAERAHDAAEETTE